MFFCFFVWAIAAETGSIDEFIHKLKTEETVRGAFLSAMEIVENNDNGINVISSPLLEYLESKRSDQIQDGVASIIADGPKQKRDVINIMKQLLKNVALPHTEELARTIISLDETEKVMVTELLCRRLEVAPDINTVKTLFKIIMTIAPHNAFYGASHIKNALVMRLKEDTTTLRTDVVDFLLEQLNVATAQDIAMLWIQSIIRIDPSEKSRIINVLFERLRTVMDKETADMLIKTIIDNFSWDQTPRIIDLLCERLDAATDNNTINMLIDSINNCDKTQTPRICALLLKRLDATTNNGTIRMLADIITRIDPNAQNLISENTHLKQTSRIAIIESILASKKKKHGLADAAMFTAMIVDRYCNFIKAAVNSNTAIAYAYTIVKLDPSPRQTLRVVSSLHDLLRRFLETTKEIDQAIYVANTIVKIAPSQEKLIVQSLFVVFNAKKDIDWKNTLDKNILKMLEDLSASMDRLKAETDSALAIQQATRIISNFPGLKKSVVESLGNLWAKKREKQGVPSAEQPPQASCGLACTSAEAQRSVAEAAIPAEKSSKAPSEQGSALVEADKRVSEALVGQGAQASAGRAKEETRKTKMLLTAIRAIDPSYNPGV